MERIALVLVALILLFLWHRFRRRITALESSVADLKKYAEVPADERIAMAVAQYGVKKAIRNREIRERKKAVRVAARIAEEKRRADIRQMRQSIEVSFKRERAWREEVAADHGWTMHPNDMTDLTPEQKAVVLEAWQSRLPQPDVSAVCSRDS